MIFQLICIVSIFFIFLLFLYILSNYQHFKKQKEERKEFYKDFYLFLYRCYRCDSVITKHCNFCKLQVCPDHSNYITVEDNLVVVCFLCQNIHKPL